MAGWHQLLSGQQKRQLPSGQQDQLPLEQVLLSLFSSMVGSLQQLEHTRFRLNNSGVEMADRRESRLCTLARLNLHLLAAVEGYDRMSDSVYSISYFHTTTRHGTSSSVPAGEVNYRANIWALR